MAAWLFGFWATWERATSGTGIDKVAEDGNGGGGGARTEDEAACVREFLTLAILGLRLCALTSYRSIHDNRWDHHGPTLGGTFHVRMPRDLFTGI